MVYIGWTRERGRMMERAPITTSSEVIYQAVMKYHRRIEQQQMTDQGIVVEPEKLYILSEYPLDELLSKVGFGMPPVKLETPYGSFDIKVNGSKFECFRRDTYCTMCGMKPNIWRLERQKQDSGKPHLNLYFQSKYGQRSILFNKDHRVAKSRGGSDKISNLITSCRICNSEKGSSPENYL